VRAIVDRQRIVTAGAMAASVLVVVLVAATQPTSGALAVAVALVLAPVATFAAAVTAARFAGGWFPPAAAVVYVLLPLLANRFVLGVYRADFDAHALPALVGVQAPALLALGVVAGLAAAFLPARPAAALGVVALVAGVLAWGVGGLGDLQPMLHETAWSVALGEWLLVATVAAAVLRRPLVGVAAGGFVVAVVLRASTHSFGHAGFWRELAPAAPLAAVLLSALGLLVPRLRPAAAPGRRAA
jgi:hypothetical protein